MSSKWWIKWKNIQNASFDVWLQVPFTTDNFMDPFQNDGINISCDQILVSCSKDFQSQNYAYLLYGLDTCMYFAGSDSLFALS